MPQCQLPTPITDPALPLRQSSFAEEFDGELCNSEAEHTVQRDCQTLLQSHLGLGDRVVVLQGTATSPRKGELKNLALSPSMFVS